MKIILVGANGWVGKKMSTELKKRGHTVLPIRHEFIFTEFLNKTHRVYDWVVNCGGVTGVPNVDACEKEKGYTLEGNAVFPVRLLDECKKYGIKMAHFSSGCIYQGHITDVNADPNFFGSTYSISKGISDVILKKEALVFRIRMPFTGEREPKNLLTKILNYAKNGKLYDSGYNSFTDLDEAVQVACDLVEEGAIGPYNLVNSGYLNMRELVELLDVYAEFYTEEEFKTVTTAERSTCVIPAYENMSGVITAMKQAITNYYLH